MVEDDYCGALFNSLQEPVIVIDRDYRIFDANEAFCNKYDKSREEMMGRRCHEVTHSIKSPCFEKGLFCPAKRVFETGLRASATHTHYLPGQDEVVEEICASPVRDSEGNILHVVEELRDMTEVLKTRETVRRLEADVRDLSGIIPICASCKKVRNDRGYWESVEKYIRTHSSMVFSHTICSDCSKRLYPELFP